MFQIRSELFLYKAMYVPKNKTGLRYVRGNICFGIGIGRFQSGIYEKKLKIR